MKLYRIKYQLMATYVTIISARNEHHALRKFKKETKYMGLPTILEFEEYKVISK